ncbi:MAG: MurR/RpiR family transcriptional regulator [Atopobium sp.]|nr:MurR/RpiR family transcriptional regulator [Atopobium sp.]RRF98308.1 MAG: MurR/RpiR family transcriptional regulator [Coriobacteriaceae bacterium]
MILERLKECEGFSKTECQVARYLLKNGGMVRDASVERLSELTESSPATIVRLCKKLGAQGYRDFRVAFVAEWEQSRHKVAIDANMPFDRDDSHEQVAWKLGNLAANAINNAISGFDWQQVDRVTNILAASDVVNVFTVGTSIPAALDFKTKLVRIGRQVNVDQDAFVQRGYAISAPAQSCNILISLSGETEMIVSYARILQARGRHTLAITANPASRLASECDEVICLNSNESDSFSRKIETFSSFDATHFVLDCLYCWLFQADYDRNMRHARESQKTLMELTNDSR